MQDTMSYPLKWIFLLARPFLQSLQEAFGKRLKELRNIKGMTQEELAEKLNISREHLGRIERGKYGCSIDLLIELSYTLNASTDYLLLGRNPDRDQDRKQLLQVISQLSDIARNM